MKNAGRRRNYGILLNVGCRAGKNPNWVGIDTTYRVGVDVVHDLTRFPYPFDDSSCHTIAAAHIIEHIPPNRFFAFMDEMWRLLKPEGQLGIATPYAGSRGFWADPTHVTHLTELSFDFFDPSHPWYMQYMPKPWRIHSRMFKPDHTIEVVMHKRLLEVAEDDILAAKACYLGAIQKPIELSMMFKEVRREKPDVVVEIGTARGGVFMGLCELAGDSAKIASIDLPGGMFGGGYTEEDVKVFRSYSRGKQKLLFLREDSHNSSTLNSLKKFLGKDRIDVLFIDGDHRYEGVKKDWEMYSPLVRPGGLVFFHDILKHPHIPDCKVDVFWNELKKKRKRGMREMVDQGDYSWGGIGMVTI